MKSKVSHSRRQFLQAEGLVAAGSLLTPAMLNVMRQQLMNVNDDLKIVASKTSSPNDSG